MRMRLCLKLNKPEWRSLVNDKGISEVNSGRNVRSWSMVDLFILYNDVNTYIIEIQMYTLKYPRKLKHLFPL